MEDFAVQKTHRQSDVQTGKSNVTLQQQTHCDGCDSPEGDVRVAKQRFVC